jgi:hypothetical protein
MKPKIVCSGKDCNNYYSGDWDSDTIEELELEISIKDTRWLKKDDKWFCPNCW